MDTIKQMCLLGLCRHLLLEFRKGDHMGQNSLVGFLEEAD